MFSLAEMDTLIRGGYMRQLLTPLGVGFLSYSQKVSVPKLPS